MLFQQRMEIIQYNAALAITGAIIGSSRGKLYQELGLETLQQSCWYRNTCKILKSQSLPILNMSYRTRQSKKIPEINVK